MGTSKILLPKHLKETVKTSINSVFKQVRDKLSTEIASLENNQQEDGNYSYSEDEIIDIQEKDGRANAMKVKNWKQEISAGNLNTQITLLKEEIEEHFEEMNGYIRPKKKRRFLFF